MSCIICGDNGKTISRNLNGMKISLCMNHSDHADGLEAKPLLQWIQ